MNEKVHRSRTFSVHESPDNVGGAHIAKGLNPFDTSEHRIKDLDLPFTVASQNSNHHEKTSSMIAVTRSAISAFNRKILRLRSNSEGIPITSSIFISQSPQKTQTASISITGDFENYSHWQHRASLLQHSGDLKDLDRGRSIHSIFIKDGCDRDVFVQNNILRMYSNCGDLASARLLFDEMPEPNLVSWTSMLSSYVQHGYAYLGLRLFSLMCQREIRPNDFGLSSAVKACRLTGELAMGKLLHGSVLDLYVKCGNMDDACRFFEGIQLKCEALWNTLIDSCIENLDAEGAVGLFHQMLLSETFPSCYTYSILIKSCPDILSFDVGRFFHGRIIKTGFEKDSFLGAALVNVYAKWGAMDDACGVFWKLEEKDEVVWSILLAGFHNSGDAEQGLNFCMRFISEGYKLDQFTITTVFNLCSDLEIPVLGLQDSFMSSAIIDMYISFGMMAEAYKVFLDVRDKNQVCFNAMISGFFSESDDRSTIELFLQMRTGGLMPNLSTINYLLGAYANLGMLQSIKALHSLIVKTYGESDLYLGNSLIEMYGKCQGVIEAAMVFKKMNVHNEFSWTAMVSAYNESERYKEGLELFLDMQSSGLAKPSQFTTIVVLQACSGLGVLDLGRQMHAYIIKSGFQSNSFVGSALIDMYAKCNSQDDALQTFSLMGEQDLVAWSIMIASYARDGNGEEALNLFSKFQSGLLTADHSIFSSCLSACASLVALDMGKQVHAKIIKNGFKYHLHVGCSVISMYCKCGSIIDARKFFDEMEKHNAVSWTAMVSGYAHHGYGKDALELFNKMKEVGIEPDGATFIGVLSACSHAGFVREGWQHFESMKDYGLEATESHYACMVDVLSRAGHIDKAVCLINAAPFESKTSLWRTVLGACSKHGNVEVGNQVAEILVKLEPDEPSTYVMLSNIYRSALMWDDSMELRNKMREDDMNKDPGISWLEQFSTALRSGASAHDGRTEVFSNVIKPDRIRIHPTIDSHMSC
ncbi:hypothetical protein ACLOJK_010866 [Asimina triloba]